MNGKLLMVFAMLTISACTALPPANDMANQPPAMYAKHIEALGNIAQFSLKGRIGVQTDKQGFSGSTFWTHGPNGDEISLFSPLGSQVASISSDSSGVRLINSDGGTYQESSAEALTQKALGWSLPMTGLSDWVVGRPTSSAVQDMQWDEEGRIKSMFQDGWKIEYDQYALNNDLYLPGKIFLKSPKLNLKFLIESWDIQTKPL